MYTFELLYTGKYRNRRSGRIAVLEGLIMKDCRSNRVLKKCMAFTAMLFCSFVILLTQSVDVKADLSLGAEISVEGPVTVDRGQTVTCNVKVKNTSTVERYMELNHWYYREKDNSETYGGTEFGTLLDSEGNKVTKTVHFAVDEEKMFTLTGVIPDTWGEKSEILVVAMGMSTEGSAFLGQGSYTAYLNNQADVPDIKPMPAELPVPEIVEIGNGNKGVDVTWTCTDTDNIDGFSIYRTKDGNSWEKISTIQDAGAVDYRDKNVSDGDRCGYIVCSYLGSEESETSVPEYTCFLKKVSVSSVKSNAVRKIKVKWRMGSYASGYQIRISTTKSFTEKTTDVIRIKGKSKTSKTISRLKGGKKYYVQVRAYRTYNGDDYYSEWSPAKSVKVMK